MREAQRLEGFRRRAAVGLTVAALIAVAQADPAPSVEPTSPTLAAGATLQDTSASSGTDSTAPATGETAGALPSASSAGSDAEPTSASAGSASADATVSALAASGIPSVALEAYQRAAASSPAACHITWPLIAAIGRVESNHGRFAGAVLHTDGRSSPRIIGIPLNGLGTALIHDTDGGRLDGDAVYDRAVGPLQFIPSTWSSHGRDGDGDGQRDPFDINDAAAATAAYLCAAGGDLSSVAGQTRAVLAYNHSDSYVATVLTLAASYAGTTPPDIPAPSEQPLPTVPPANPAPPPAAPEAPIPTPTPTAESQTP